MQPKIKANIYSVERVCNANKKNAIMLSTNL